MFAGSPHAAMLAPSVPTSTMRMAGMLRTTMTFVPSIVAPIAMPMMEMTMPMPVPNFMAGAPWSGSRLLGARPRR
jgi:hypothetical protein